MHTEDDNFFLVLPSNSSMKYFPNNTTTRYTTQLSREIHLSGRWTVGLSEIHIPCTMIHLQPHECLITWAAPGMEKSGNARIPRGIYKSHEELCEKINNLSGLRAAGIQVAQDKKAHGYVRIIGETSEKLENAVGLYELFLSPKIRRVLGFNITEGKDDETPEGSCLRFNIGERRSADLPASITRALPEQLFIYTDICESYTVGDTQAALLRIVNLNTSNYTYGVTVVKYFTPPNYIPLLNNCFRSIDIDIRDHLGEPIAFEYGTLTLTLHFRRIS